MQIETANGVDGKVYTTVTIEINGKEYVRVSTPCGFAAYQSNGARVGRISHKSKTARMIDAAIEAAQQI